MGNEVVCMVKHEGKIAQVRALLETDRVILRGDIKATIPFDSLKRIDADHDVLYLDKTELQLGAQAAKWQKKILHPPTLLEKLGLKVGMAVDVMGFDDLTWLSGFRPATEPPFDAMLVRVENSQDLPIMEAVEGLIQIGGMFWIIYPKGLKHFTEAHVRQHGIEGGWVDVKTCKFDETYTGLKFLRRKVRP